MPANRKRKTGETYKQLWLTLRICGHRVRVFIWDDYPHDGGYNPENETINIQRAAEQPDRMYDTLIHEVFHAIVSLSGLGHQLNEKTRMSKREWDRFEECMVRGFVPGIFAAFGDAGWLKLPKVPR